MPMPFVEMLESVARDEAPYWLDKLQPSDYDLIVLGGLMRRVIASLDERELAAVQRLIIKKETTG